MKKVPRKLLAWLLTLSSLLCLPVFASASQALGEDLSSTTVAVGQGAAWTSGVFWSTSQSDLRAENYVTYSPNSMVTPIVTYGSSITSRTKVSTIAASLESSGYRVVAGINGDFYNTANGVPLGLVVTDGVIRSGSGDYYGIGFRTDGSVITGRPSFVTTATYAVMDPMTGIMTEGSVAIQDINKDRTDKGVYLYTRDFNAKRTTGTTAAGTDVVLNVTGGSLTIGGTVTGTVASVRTDAVGALSVEQDQIVLSANNSSPALYRTALQQMTPGTQVTITVSASDTGWNSVRYAVGALFQLVVQGTVSASITSISGSAPRTALGVKADGSLVLYTIDGRQTGVSVGATYAMVARRLIELGCVTAYAMDGGGSTTMVVSKPGRSAAVCSTPSDGYERSVTNQILLVAPAGYATGVLSGYYVEPSSSQVLAGSDFTVQVSGYDSGFFPVNAASYTLTASGGSVSGATVTAPSSAGSLTVTASGSGGSGSAVVQVVASPDTLSILKSGSAVTSLSVQCGSATKLAVKATANHLTLPADSKAVTWTVSGNLGSVGADGTLTAGNLAGSGTLTAQAGAVSLSIPLTVTSSTHFTDTTGNWAAEYIDKLYERGVVTGYPDGSFLPDASITRQQFAAMLYRALGLNDADYAGAALPFADADSVSGYAQTSVKALCALGIVTGTEAGGKTWFYPGSALTRAQASAMIGRALRVSSDAVPSFTDAADIPAYARLYISALTERGILGGFSDGSFRPKSNITRAQMSKMLYMMLAQ